MGISFDEIAMKIVEKEDNLIAKAFTMQIATLLRQNGIIPIVTRTEETPETVSGKNNYILTKKFGVSFHELDCTEHDKEIYDNAIDDFAENLICELKNRHTDMPIVDIFGSRERWKNKNLQYLECENLIYKIAEQLKAGRENE